MERYFLFDTTEEDLGVIYYYVVYGRKRRSEHQYNIPNIM